MKRLSLLLLAGLLIGCGGGGDGGGGGVSSTDGGIKQLTSVVVVGGDNQTGVAGTELQLPLVAKLLDASGNVLAGQVVNFRVALGGGSVFGGASSSDANGLVRERWILGTTAGPQTLEIRVVDSKGEAVVLATFRATAAPGPAAVIKRDEASNNQAAKQMQPLPLPVKVTVTDQFGHPVSGVDVTFSPLSPNHGTTTPAVVTTNTMGEASSNWTLGLPVGTLTLTATVTGLTAVTFTAHAYQAPPSAPTAISIAAGDGQTVMQHSKIPAPLTVYVTDALLNALPGIAVTYSASPGSGYITPSTVNTVFDGYATWKGYFNSPGQQKVNAAVAGLPPVTFTVNVSPSTHRFDGYYLCQTSPSIITIEMNIVNGVVSGIEAYEPGHVLGSTPLNEADGTWENAPYRASLDGRWTFSGQFFVDANDRATGLGTYTRNDGGPGSWTCVRQ